MASRWKAELVKTERKGALVVPSVKFTRDDGKSFVEEFPGDDVTKERLAVLAGKRIASLDSGDAAEATLESGPLTPKDEAPDEDAVARATFFAELVKLNALRAAADKGIMAADAPDLVAARDRVAELFAGHPEYTTDPRWR